MHIMTNADFMRNIARELDIDYCAIKIHNVVNDNSCGYFSIETSHNYIWAIVHRNGTIRLFGLNDNDGDCQGNFLLADPECVEQVFKYIKNFYNL